MVGSCSAGGTGLGGGQPVSTQRFQHENLEGVQAALLAETTAKLRDEGYAVVPNIIPHAEIAAVRETALATLARRDAEAAASTDGFQSELAQRVSGSFISVDDSLWPYLGHPQVLGVAENLWRTTHIKLTSTSPIPRALGADGTSLPRDSRGFHSDWPYNTHGHAAFVPEPYSLDAPLHLTVIFMLTPFTAGSATLIVPGSHKLGHNFLSMHDPPVGAELPEALPVPLVETPGIGDEGSVLMFDARMWHGAPVHTDTAPRLGVGVRYAPWWMNHLPLFHGSAEREAMLHEGEPEANVVHNLPREVWGRMPEDAQRLMRVWVTD